MLDIRSLHRKEYEVVSQPGKKNDKDVKTGRNTANNAIVIAQAPGRILFLGEQGDFGSGLYLSAAIDRYVKTAVSARKDNSLRFFAANLGERKRTTLVNLKYKREDRWANYVKVAIHVFIELGVPLKGLDFTIAGDIPQQIGLASSSAIEIASAVALRGFLRVKISDLELTKRLTASHSLFFGKNVNPVDYLVGFSAQKDHFLVVDESNLTVSKIKSPFSRSRYLLIDSRVPRMEVENEMNARKEDLKAALEMLSLNRDRASSSLQSLPDLPASSASQFPSVLQASFREFAATDLLESMGNFPEEIRRRSMHIVQEIRRINDAGDCLVCSDLSGFSRMIFNSHESLRDLYEVSCPEIDWIVKRAQETEGVFGARMTGQGFGGSTYAIVKKEAVSEYRSRIDDYERIFGFRPMIYEVKLSTGARICAASSGTVKKKQNNRTLKKK